MCGDIERLVDSVRQARNHRADRIHVAANGEDGMDGLVEKLFEAFALVTGDVDTDFRHDFGGHWMEITGWF